MYYAILFIVYICNVVFWLIGGTMLGLGIWMAVDPHALDSLSASSGMQDGVMAAAVYTMIGIGALLFLVGGLGCCGAGGNSFFLTSYIILVSVVMVAEVAVIVLVAVFWNSISEDIKVSMYDDVTLKYYRGAEKALTKSWDSMQQNWKCCGSYNYTDYKCNEAINVPPVTANWKVPPSCCRESEYNSPNYAKCLAETVAPPPRPTAQYLYEKGCYDGLEDWLDYTAPILIGITGGFIAIQIVGLITASCTLWKRNKELWLSNTDTFASD